MYAVQEQKRPQEVIITVPSKAEYVGWARRVVEGVARDGGLSTDAIEDVKLAVGEACSNAITHGSPNGHHNTISVQCRINQGGLIIEVKDQGPGFRLSRVRKIAPPDLSEGGRGLILIRMLMDEVTYRHSLRGGTLRMVKRMIA